MDPITTTVVTGFVGAIAAELGHECVREHINDIKKGINNTKEFVSNEFNNGCQRDYEAGGITSWRQEPQTQTA